MQNIPKYIPGKTADAGHSQGLRRRTVLTAAALLLVVLLLVWLGTRNPDLPPPPTAHNATQAETLSEAADAAEVIPFEAEEPAVFKGEVNPGDTASTILYDWLPNSDVQSMIEACKDIYSLSRIRAGNPYTVITDADGLHRFEYEIDSEQKLVISRAHESYEACLEAIAYDVRLERIAFTIDSNMFQAVADAGEGPSLAIALADIFGWEVDFIRNIREGDSFVVLVEKRFQDGEFKRYGPVLAAKFTNQGKEYEAFYYLDTEGAGFFTRGGDSMKRAFLKAPLSFTRISSGYNLRRLHPIFKEVRPHPAIDYAAPAGTPVKAIGNGVISFVGWGKGAGKHIVIKHPNDYESIYMHLSGYAKGVGKGTRVQQGQVIGYVGSTGYATGPHLDFRIKHKGQYINPSTVTSPRSEPVSATNLADFAVHVERYLAWLDGSLDLSDYPLVELEETPPAAGQENDAVNRDGGLPAAGSTASELDGIVIDGTGPAEH